MDWTMVLLLSLKVSQGLAETLGINWKLHCVYLPRAQGKKRKITEPLQETLTKLTLETGMDCLVPFALDLNTP